MRARTWIVSAALFACAPALTEPAAPGPATAEDPTPLPLAAWVSFFAGFDDGLDAELAVGGARPSRVQGAPTLEEGRVGRALRLGGAAGGARVDYPLEGNLDFARPGGLTFWISPQRWEEPGSKARGLVRFVRVVSGSGSVFAVQREARRGARESLASGFSGLPDGEAHMLPFEAGPAWRQGDWHLVAVTWDADGFEISVDGGPFIRRAVPAGRIRNRFGGAGAAGKLSLGDHGPESSLLDEIVVYTRPLRQEDVLRLWRRQVWPQ